MSNEHAIRADAVTTSTPRPPWREFVRKALRELRGEASLQVLYAKVDEMAQPGWLTRHWKAKVRQVVQQDLLIKRIADGVWRLRQLSNDDDLAGTA